MPTRKGSCPTGKRVYYQERLANRAITEAAKRGELPTMRHYQCPECGWWHLSRKARLVIGAPETSDVCKWVAQ
jgi:hypothetical protein